MQRGKTQTYCRHKQDLYLVQRKYLNMENQKLKRAKDGENIFPEGFIEQLDLKDRDELVKLYQDFGTLGVRKWIGDWNKKQGDE